MVIQPVIWWIFVHCQLWDTKCFSGRFLLWTPSVEAALCRSPLQGHLSVLSPPPSVSRALCCAFMMRAFDCVVHMVYPEPGVHRCSCSYWRKCSFFPDHGGLIRDLGKRLFLRSSYTPQLLRPLLVCIPLSAPDCTDPREPLAALRHLSWRLWPVAGDGVCRAEVTSYP